MTRRWLIVAVLIATGVGVWWARRKPANYPDAYVADRSATLWSATAQVRRQVGKLGYGERVSVMGRAGELTEVRAADGTQGWIDNRLLMAPALWKQVGQLLADARSMPVQAKGHTRTLSNVRIDPGRDSARIFQFGHNVSVAVLERRVAAMPASDKDEDKSGDDGADRRRKTREIRYRRLATGFVSACQYVLGVIFWVVFRSTGRSWGRSWGGSRFGAGHSDCGMGPLAIYRTRSPHSDRRLYERGSQTGGGLAAAQHHFRRVWREASVRGGGGQGRRGAAVRLHFHPRVYLGHAAQAI